MCLAIAMYILTATFGILSKIAVAIGIFLLNFLGRMIYFMYALGRALMDSHTETESVPVRVDDQL